MYLRVRRLLARSHNAAYVACKKVRPEVSVGIVKHIILFHSNANPFNWLLAAFMNWHWTHSFMRRVQKRCDEIGLNYYIHKKFGDRETYEKTDMNWDVYPEGIYACLKMLRRYKKPIYVSEAGLADAADRMRADYIRRQIKGVRRAIADGVDVRGHMYWSLLDNYEWALGFEKRFGLVEINYDTLERTVRPSAYVYRDIIEASKERRANS
jgi:beta-glucosidase